MQAEKRLLIIDDDPMVRLTLAAFLENVGYQVRQAVDGSAGIHLLRSEQHDLVLCDLRMPGRDGLEVLAHARQHHPDVPVIVISGAGLLGDAIAAIKLGATDYLTKPFTDLAVVDLAVRRALEHAALVQENARYRAHLEEANTELSASLRQLQQDQDAGRQIQFRLMPEGRRVYHDYEVTYDLITSARLSGDFVDCFPVDDARLAFYIADVAGHGVSSAFITVFLKSFMARLKRQHGEIGLRDILSPSQTLDALNRDMLREGLNKHLTVFYGIINRDTGELVYSSGGQYPCPILYDGSQTKILDSQGLPIGLFEFASYKEWAVTLPRRFVLTICSDGVLELLPEQTLEQKGQRLRALVGSLDASVQTLRESFHLEGVAPPDDATVLMIRRAA